MSQRITVDTKIDWNNLLIVQDTYSPDFEHTIREVMNTKDDHIRKALIQMDWTPPL